MEKAAAEKRFFVGNFGSILLQPGTAVHYSKMDASKCYREDKGQQQQQQIPSSASRSSVIKASWRWKVSLDSTFVLSLSNTLAMLAICTVYYWRCRDWEGGNRSDDHVRQLEARIEHLEHLLSPNVHDAPSLKDSNADYLDTFTDDHQKEFPAGVLGTNATGRVKRNTGSSATEGVKAVQLVNVRETILSGPMGLVTHWVVDSGAVGRPSQQLLRYTSYDITDMGSSILVKEEGLYQVYAQLFFESRSGNFNQFEIRSRVGDRNPKSLATCSVVAPEGTGIFDVSCYTSVMVSLGVGNKVYLQMNEVGRRVNTSVGKSFFGIVKLSS